MKVTVVIPTYNQAQYLGDAINSVLAQSYTDYEIIIVDDGSIDDTKQVVGKFGSFLKYIFQSNKGLAGSRNTGIREANGDYVAFLDSDDKWCPEFLTTMVSLASEHPDATVLYCGASYIDTNGRVLPQPSTISYIPPAKMYKSLLRSNMLIPSSILIKRSSAIVAGLFDISFRRLQDWEFWLRLSKAGHIFMGANTCMVHYRLHNNNLSWDTAGGNEAIIALAQKHFGFDDNEWSNWPADKREMYGGVYRYHALNSALIKEGDWISCAHYFRRCLQIDPTLASDLSFFYELSLGEQPIGYRGTTLNIDIMENVCKVQRLLKTVFDDPPKPELVSIRHTAYSTAYYALGLVAYLLGMTIDSRNYLMKAIGYRSKLVLDRQVIITLLKCVIGRDNVGRLRHWKQYLGI
jgi:glycosyltransferase involved in cell wall biosynthesis